MKNAFEPHLSDTDTPHPLDADVTVRWDLREPNSASVGLYSFADDFNVWAGGIDVRRSNLLAQDLEPYARALAVASKIHRILVAANRRGK